MTAPRQRLYHVVTLAIAAIGAVLVSAPRAAAQEAVYVVRHAERADSSEDSVLSPAGEARARRLAAVLKDAGITRIFTSERRRTIQTAAPLAESLKLQTTSVPSRDYDALLAEVDAAAPQDRVFVVGHSNTIPEILRRLGVATPIEIEDGEYDNLFVVIRRNGSPSTLMRFKF